jgi:hypothetical protein
MCLYNYIIYSRRQITRFSVYHNGPFHKLGTGAIADSGIGNGIYENPILFVDFYDAHSSKLLNASVFYIK